MSGTAPEHRDDDGEDHGDGDDDHGDDGDDHGDNVACCGIHNVDANDADVHE